MSALSKEQLRHLHERLLHRQQELRDLNEQTASSTQPVELDQSRVGRLSRMEAMQDQAMSQEAGRRRQQELRNIATAVQRLERGEFGYCQQCGEPIKMARLELDPAYSLCIGCANRAEANGV